MTDFDALIDEVVESAKECENEHEHRGFYTDSIEKNHAVARSALRAAIDEVVKERDNLLTVLHGNQDADYDKQLQIETLNEKLAEAEADAERLATKYVRWIDRRSPHFCAYCGGTIIWGGMEKHSDDCPITLHNARVGKAEG